MLNETQLLNNTYYRYMHMIKEMITLIQILVRGFILSEAQLHSPPLIIRLPSSPFSPLQPLMPFPSMPGSPVRSERKGDKAKNITHNCWILYSVQLSSQAFQLLLIGIASFSVLAISPVFIRHSALIGSF